MRIAVLLPLLLALSSPLRSEDKKESQPEYGERSAQTITIRAEGEVEKPGIYHVRAGITFSEFIEHAGMSRLSNGRFTVSRTVQGRTESIHIRYDAEKRAFIPDLLLLDGDFVWAAFNMTLNR